MPSTLRRYLRRMWRASLGPQSLLTLAEAAQALPGRREKARAWLLANVQPCGKMAGLDVYSWGAIVAAMVQSGGAGVNGTAIVQTDRDESGRNDPARTSRPAKHEEPKRAPVEGALLDVNEVAALLRLTPKGIYSLVESRRIPHVKVAHRVRFVRATVLNWLVEGNRVPSEDT